MVKVSIIMPVYNAGELIKEAIDSAVTQTLKDIEIVCVDDGSSDNSVEILEELSKKHDCIRIFTQENEGSGSARNHGLDEATGEYIAFLDADDAFVDANALEVLYDIGCKNNADLVCGNLKRLSVKTGRVISNPNYKAGNYHYFDEIKTITPQEYGVPWAFYKNIFKRTFLNEHEIRFKDLRRGQDPVFLSEVLANVDIIYGGPVDLYAYRFESGQPYKKIDTPEKKLHYLLHFKGCFDALEKGGLHETSETFKEKLIYFFNYGTQLDDLTIYDGAMEVFGWPTTYFDNFKYEYESFLVHHILNKILVEDSEEFYTEAKEKLSEMGVWYNDLIPTEKLRNLILLFDTDSYNEYKE
ncbi:MAG: glycosyltransferase family 2 protein, partial [Methanobrevibacter sp.]|nr:glycosyltransferase family 2 protein [Methanobrevibacter sp.]